MYRRNIIQRVLAALADTRVVLVHGARQVGKTTLVKSLAVPIGALWSPVEIA